MLQLHMQNESPPAVAKHTFGRNGCAAMFSSLRRSDMIDITIAVLSASMRAGLPGYLPGVGSCVA